MKIQVLGCSGGIGGSLRTTSLLVDEDILIDAGTGVGNLALDNLALIDHVFLTHAHLDHVALLPLMLDSVGAMRSQPLIVHALPEVIDVLKRHIFNWHIWPDFSVLPTEAAPYLRYEPLSLGQIVSVGKRRFTALPVNHVVPACGYAIASDKNNALVFSGDTGTCAEFWHAVNCVPHVRTVIIETAFPNTELKLALAAKHLCPSLLATELMQLKAPADIYITHLKPGEAELTMKEAREDAASFAPQALRHGQIFIL